MRSIVSTLFIAVSIASAAGVTGRWEGPMDLKDNNGRTLIMHMKLQQDAEKISGGVWIEDHDEAEPRPVRNATLNGNRMRFEVPQRGDLVVEFELALDADTLEGTAKFQGPNGPQQVKLSLKRVAER